MTWEELVSLMKDESKGNMELPIAAPPVDMSGRDDYFAILQGKQISATREINLGFFTFPSWGKKKTEYEDQLSRKLEAFSMQSKTHKADISEIVEKKIATKEPIRDVSMIEKEEELAEAEAQVTPEDFEALFDSESEIEDENESMEGSKEAYSTEAQLIGCRFTPTDENELKQLRELLRARNPDHVTTEKYNIDMTELKLSCLRPSTWLNDEVINTLITMFMYYYLCRDNISYFTFTIL